MRGVRGGEAVGAREAGEVLGEASLQEPPVALGFVLAARAGELRGDQRLADVVNRGAELYGVGVRRGGEIVETVQQLAGDVVNEDAVRDEARRCLCGGEQLGGALG